MTKAEQINLILEGKLVLNEMISRQKQGDNSFDDQIIKLSKEWDKLVKSFVEETV